MASSVSINGKDYQAGVDFGSGLGHTLIDHPQNKRAEREAREEMERHRDVLVPPSPEQIDGHIADYEAAKAEAEKAKERVQDAKKIIVFLADNFGHRAQGAEQSVRLAGVRNAALVTRGSTVVIDEAALLELKLAVDPLPGIFELLFAAQTTHKLLKGARTALLSLCIPKRKHEKLLSLFGKCFDVKTNEPSLKVEVIKPEKPAKKPRASKPGKEAA
jgi:hypothetical protein